MSGQAAAGAGFDAGWLALREPADRAARDPGLKARFLDLAAGEVLDLGCGTGSTFRALAPEMARPCRWRLADHDPRLLDAARQLLPQKAEIAFEQLDLTDLDSLRAGPETWVSASALFDLCSAAFVRDLFAHLAASGVPAVYAALNYDGDMRWSLPHPLDEQVREAFNLHQTGDKGFGPAMGPASGAGLAAAAEAAGYAVQRAASPWRLGPEAAELQDALHAGIATAVTETGRVPQAALEGWLDHRRHAARAAGSLAVIGHEDVLAERR